MVEGAHNCYFADADAVAEVSSKPPAHNTEASQLRIPLRAYETISFVRVTKATLVRPPGLRRQACLVPPGRQARR